MFSLDEDLSFYERVRGPVYFATLGVLLAGMYAVALSRSHAATIPQDSDGADVVAMADGDQ